MSNTQFKVSRRDFFKGTALGAAMTAVGGNVASSFAKDSSPTSVPASSYTSTGRSAQIFSELVKEPVKILQISDSHLFLDDERGDDYKQYSDRMAKAYNHTKRYYDGKDTTPTEMLAEIAEEAAKENYDAVALTGDIVSFPSAAGVDYVKSCLDKIGAPYYYVCGNHDWHFEGMEGTERELRDEWIQKRLQPLYPKGVDPLCYSVEIKGVKIIMIDDSIYEILPKQLDFVTRELSENKPSLAFMHIPLYAPGRRVAYGVGHPDWNAEHDQQLYKIERRPQWPAEGHNETTYRFRETLLNAPNLLGVFTGHIHSNSLDVLNGKASQVTSAALDGSTFKIEIAPYPHKG